jgi:glutaredoxin 3
MKAVVWSSVGCVWCDKAKALLESRNIETEVKVVGNGYTKQDLIEAVPNARSVPQIFLDGEYVGGYDKLAERLN